MRIHCLMHVPFEGPAAIADWSGRSGHALARTLVWEGGPLPGLDDFDFLVVMGGPMSVNDVAELAWLGPEKALIRAAVEAGKKVLGVCLGAQLIAAVLGGTVGPGEHCEIGFFPVRLLPEAEGLEVFKGLPEAFEPLHWHGETFTIPEGAVRAARSDGCANQAFVYDRRVVGLQFHLEATPESLGRLVDHCGSEIGPGPFMQSGNDMLAKAERLDAANALLFGLLDRLASL